MWAWLAEVVDDDVQDFIRGGLVDLPAAVEVVVVVEFEVVEVLQTVEFECLESTVSFVEEEEG